MWFHYSGDSRILFCQSPNSATELYSYVGVMKTNYYKRGQKYSTRNKKVKKQRQENAWNASQIYLF